jgi:hypothetical protein
MELLSIEMQYSIYVYMYTYMVMCTEDNENCRGRELQHPNFDP